MLAVTEGIDSNTYQLRVIYQVKYCRRQMRSCQTINLEMKPQDHNTIQMTSYICKTVVKPSKPTYTKAESSFVLADFVLADWPTFYFNAIFIQDRSQLPATRSDSRNRLKSSQHAAVDSVYTEL